MKRWVLMFAVVMIFLCGASHAAASEINQPEGQPEAEQDLMEKADRLVDIASVDTTKEAIVLYEKMLAADPDNYEVMWKCAKAYREHGDAVKRAGLADWKQTCTQIGKTGMEYAQKAIALGPDKPEGYFFYGLNVGIYSDGVGILTAIKEGLKDKTQSNFEKAYEMDKMIEDGGPIIALGRYWQVVPWPFNDKDKAESLYREFQTTRYYDENVESRVYFAELLAGKWGRKNKEEARKLLEEVPKITNDPYWVKQASELLSSL